MVVNLIVGKEGTGFWILRVSRYYVASSLKRFDRREAFVKHLGL